MNTTLDHNSEEYFAELAKEERASRDEYLDHLYAQGWDGGYISRSPSQARQIANPEEQVVALTRRMLDTRSRVHILAQAMDKLLRLVQSEVYAEDAPLNPKLAKVADIHVMLLRASEDIAEELEID